MSAADIPVRVDGKSYRFIMKDGEAAIFSKLGLVKKLTVVDSAEKKRVPEVADEEGNPVKLLRTSRPCSCKGAPWNRKLADLMGEVSK